MDSTPLETADASGVAVPELSAKPRLEDTGENRQVFPIAPFIRLTLLLLYVALMGPLPFLAKATEAPVSPLVLTVGIVLGWIGLYGALGQRVVVDDQAIEVTYPAWIRWLFRGGWRLPWDQAQAIKPRSTGQGGIVYYFVGADPVGGQPKAYLLPMRVAGFARLVGLVQRYTNLDTQDIKPLAQPWMYGILLLFTLFLLLIDLWTISTALSLPGAA
ncbi:hypothetical protein GFS31_20160 [Leptolyngbya sp. BL0902]|uniref:hypothetical protein n=1 Tax=Leptolyngbya sp. BL0902 TaxID=1115757 RepID=UPI001936CFD4|nr:hypothetical protein [Leptolyngbya sp. BL0902]QQE65329.1 hypothetical protein GFS31_20160 [Leptolyngbya sp. BL0902]